VYVSLVVCLWELSHVPLRLSLVVRCDLTSYSLRATASHLNYKGKLGGREIKDETEGIQEIARRGERRSGVGIWSKLLAVKF
jgi:hypothetical protein